MNKMLITDKIKSDEIDFTQFIEYKKSSEALRVQEFLQIEVDPNIQYVRLFVKAISRYLNRTNICRDIKMDNKYFYRFIYCGGEISNAQLSRLCEIMQTFGFKPINGITIDRIKKVVCEYFNIPVEYIDLKTRKREIVQARQIAMYFAKKITKFSLSMIALQIGDKDHSTCLFAIKQVYNLIETDKLYAKQIKEIEKLL
jgi:hypothetical protein